MPPKKTSYDNISGQVREQAQRFITRYSRGVEGFLISTGEQVFLWTLQMKLTSKEEVQDIYNRLRFFIESGARTLPVIDYGVDRRGVAYLLTQWKKVDSVALAGRTHSAPAALYSQMVDQIAKLHAGGMPFGDIAEDSFLLDPLDRVVLAGIPAFGFPVPSGPDGVQNYIAPEAVDKSKLPYEQDIYALGVYAHQLFTRRPFPRATSRKQLEEHLEVQTPTLLALYRNLPEWAAEAINGAIRWEPDERITIRELASLARTQLGFGHRLTLFLTNLGEFKFSRPRARGVAQVSVSGQTRAGAPSSIRPEVRNILLGGGALIVLVLGLIFALPRISDTTDTPSPISWNPNGSASGESHPAADVKSVKSALDGMHGEAAGANDIVVSDPFGSKNAAKNSATESKRNVFGSLGAGDSDLPPADQNVFAEWAKARRDTAPSPRAETGDTPPTTGAVRSTDREGVSTSLSTNNVRLSVLNAAPDRELLALAKRAREIPADQFTTAARELLARGRLRLAPRLALFTLLRSNVKSMPAERLGALLSVLDDRIRLSELNVLSHWGSIDGALVLAALASQSWAPETTNAAFLNFASTPVSLEPLRSVLTRVKLEHWDLSIAEMRAVATVSLGPLAESEDDAAAVKRLTQRLSPLELLLLLSGSLPSYEDAPWCPRVESTGT